MLTKEAIAFAELGRLARESNLSESLTDSRLLSEIKEFLEEGFDSGIDRIVSATRQANGDIKGVFEDSVGFKSRRFSFVVDDNGYGYKPINPNPKFTEEEIEFAASGKQHKCNPSKSHPCKGRCISLNKECRPDSTPETKKKAKDIKDKAAASVGVSSRAPEAKVAMPDPKQKKEKLTQFPQSKVGSIKSYEDFEPVALYTIAKLYKNREGTDNFIPIYKIRRELGELVDRKQFQEYMFAIQNKRAVTVSQGSVEDSAPDKIADSLVTKTGTIRTHIEIKDTKELDKYLTPSIRKKVEETLKERPPLDPAGRAGKLKNGSKVKDQDEAERLIEEARKRIDEDFNYQGSVPIAKVRQALGDRIDDFDRVLKDAQARDRVTLETGADASEEDKKAGIKNSFGEIRSYMRVGDSPASAMTSADLGKISAPSPSTAKKATETKQVEPKPKKEPKPKAEPKAEPPRTLANPTQLSTSRDKAQIAASLDAWKKETEKMDIVNNIYVLESKINRTKQWLKDLTPQQRESKATDVATLESRLLKSEDELRRGKEYYKDNEYLKVDPARFSASHDISESVLKGSADRGVKQFGVYDKNGNLQAAANYSVKKNSVYIDELATAPWNIKAGGADNRSTKGAGTQAVVEAVRLSSELGKGGRVTLEALEDAKPFYEKLGFKSKKSDDTQMELSPKAAKELLAKMGIE